MVKVDSALNIANILTKYVSCKGDNISGETDDRLYIEPKDNTDVLKGHMTDTKLDPHTAIIFDNIYHGYQNGIPNLESEIEDQVCQDTLRCYALTSQQDCEVDDTCCQPGRQAP